MSEFDDNVYDAEVDDSGEIRVKQPKGRLDRFVDWCKAHPIICVIGVILLPISLILLGAKLFSSHTTEEVEVVPETIYDGMHAVPVETETTTRVKWVMDDPEE